MLDRHFDPVLRENSLEVDIFILNSADKDLCASSNATQLVNATDNMPNDETDKDKPFKDNTSLDVMFTIDNHQMSANSFLKDYTLYGDSKGFEALLP